MEIICDTEYKPMSLISQTNGPAANQVYWGATVSGGGGGGGGSAPTVVSFANNVWWTQQTWIPNTSQVFRPEVAGSDTSNGNVVIPPRIIDALTSNSNYTTLRIDSTFPITEDQGDGPDSPGRYYQTALQASCLDTSAFFSFPATQFHMILDASGSPGYGTDQGLFLGNSGTCFPFSLVLNKTIGTLTASAAQVTFQLSTTSSSNAKFYIGSSVATSNNICPMIFTLTA